MLLKASNTILMSIFLSMGCSKLHDARDARAAVAGKRSSCQVKDVVKDVARALIRKSNAPDMQVVKEHHFVESDPLIALPEISEIAVFASASVEMELRDCGFEQRGAIGWIADPDWRARAIVLAMAQTLRDEPVDLSLAYAGYAIDLLNELPVLSPPPDQCAPESVARPADFGGLHWFQHRVLAWVKCKDGSLLVYLPEAGWFVPNEAQTIAVEASVKGG